ncbi:MAG: lytic transglycosylase domain-containing protein [Candidatus Methylomirabilales bacterium]
MRKITLFFLWGLLLSIMLPGWATASGARIYRRVDGSGVTHYSNLPSPRELTLRARRRANPAGSGLWALISLAAHRHGVDPRLVEAIIAVESDFDPGAVSPKGAMGLMQLMPETARRYAVQNPFDPLENIGGGIRYLRDLLYRFQGDLRAALAAYNAGETAVTVHRGIPPYRETREYVTKVLRRYRGPTGLFSRHAPVFRVYRLPGPGGRSMYSNVPPRLPLR